MIIKQLGRYNFAGSDKEWSVQIRLPDGKWLSEMWPEDKEPDIEGLPPSEVIELIATRLEEWWICTGREEKRERIAYARSVAAQMDHDWASAEIARLEKRIASLRDHLIEQPEQAA
ncbi:hypothetical protein DC522_05730 [Microvirga sp. KLBC 81]|uniref:hypothetical protein n=1 Tax=Microvirga sp. KLBC 81 TaxID=1862707 RepID=UPI000D520FA8|nr:hypothetical protein [Microvirga sp. KLBC 81]PVE25397.1 hypothetical protein DC522_05730 [Microvirga sp. KLBC 81]